MITFSNSEGDRLHAQTCPGIKTELSESFHQLIIAFHFANEIAIKRLVL